MTPDSLPTEPPDDSAEPTRIDHIPSHVSPPTDGIVYCTINRQHFRVPCGHYTGAAIRGWHEPPISGDRDLWLTVPGGPDEQYGEVDEYLFDRSGTRWFDTPRFINASSDSAEPLSAMEAKRFWCETPDERVATPDEVDQGCELGIWFSDCGRCFNCRVQAELDRLTARVTELEGQVDEWRSMSRMWKMQYATAEHRVSELEDEQRPDSRKQAGLSRGQLRAKLKAARKQQRRTHENIVNVTASLATAEHRIEELTAERDAAERRARIAEDLLATAQHRYRGLEAAARECVDAAKDLRKYVSPDSGCGYFTYKRIWDSSMQAETHFVHALAALSDKEETK